MDSNEELKDLLASLSGKKKPVKYDIKFIKHEFDEPMLIAGDIAWYVDDIGSAYLHDLFDKKIQDKIPSENGVYSAELWMSSFRCNHPEDPEEWDMNMWLENIKLEMKL
jgi:hypothetical protein